MDRSLLKKRFQNICFYTLTNTSYFFKGSCFQEQPLKFTKSPIKTPKKYNNHPYHPNIGSTPPRAKIYPGSGISFLKALPPRLKRHEHCVPTEKLFQV